MAVIKCHGEWLNFSTSCQKEQAQVTMILALHARQMQGTVNVKLGPKKSNVKFHSPNLKRFGKC
jgi:hypothetical protein